MNEEVKKTVLNHVQLLYFLLIPTPEDTSAQSL